MKNLNKIRDEQEYSLGAEFLTQTNEIDGKICAAFVEGTRQGVFSSLRPMVKRVQEIGNGFGPYYKCLPV